MKKILAALLLVALAATSSFAVGVSASATGKGVKDDAGLSIFPQNTAGEEKTIVGKLSTGVYFAWATLETFYAIKTQHASGMKAFATASDSTAINWKPILAKGQDLPAPPAAATNSALINEGGWSVM